jgi:sister chromatid cohesion protein DCC1
MPEPRLLRFSDTPGSSHPTQRSTYQLLALPPALLSLLLSPDSPDSTPLEIRGDPTDSAALVTSTQTYALRGVQNSNSLCICSSGENGGTSGKWFNKTGRTPHLAHSEDEEMQGRDDGARPRKRIKEDIEIEAILHETLEAVVGVARTDKLPGFLKGCEYKGEAAEIESPVSHTSPH